MGMMAASYKPTASDKIDMLIDTVGQDGMWDANPYLHGILNGLIAALSVVTDSEPTFRGPPDEYLEDKIPVDIMGPLEMD
jgi:hypothetical protein